MSTPITEPPSQQVISASLAFPAKANASLNDAIAKNRRSNAVIRQGLKLERHLFEQLQILEDEIASLDDVSLSPPPKTVFGRDLISDSEGYLSLPPDIALLSGSSTKNNEQRFGVTSSKIANLRISRDNPLTRINFSSLNLADAIRFICEQAELPVVLSAEVESSPAQVTLNVEAGILSILDAVLNQHNVAIIYNATLEVAQVYTDSELGQRLSDLHEAVRQYNDNLRAFNKRAALTRDRERMLEMIAITQTLLSGDTEAFIAATEDLPRQPGGKLITEILNMLTITRLDMIEWLAESVEINAASALAPQPLGASLGAIQQLGVLDPCIYPGREVFTEKIAVYGGQNALERISAILEGYYASEPDSFTVQSTGDNTTISSSIIVQRSGGDSDRPKECGGDPAASSPNFVSASDFSGFVVSGLLNDIELFVKLVEEFDRPPRQVLIEVFMINVVKDFSRKLNLSLQTDALASDVSDTGEFFLRRNLTQLSQDVESTSPGGFVAGLLSQGGNAQALVDFIETNNLGRTISSPTILVEEGSSASVTRTNSKPVVRNRVSTIFDSNNNPVTVSNPETINAEASFELNVSDVAVNPNNNNVRLTFSLSDESFETTLANVNDTTGQTRDNISTKFVAAPGDVIVMAGLFKQSDSVEAIGLPGSTTTGLPTSFLFGGSDNVGNKIEEMIILMAPTVIEPEIGKPAPNSAFGNKRSEPTSESQ